MKKKNNELLQRFMSFDKKLIIWQWLAIGFFILLIIHLILIQIVDLKHYKQKAKRQRMVSGAVMRGMIVDANGIKLASDKVVYDVWAHPHVYDHTPAQLANVLSPILEIPYEKLKEELSKDYKIISLKKDVSKRVAKEIAKLVLKETGKKIEIKSFLEYDELINDWKIGPLQCRVNLFDNEFAECILKIASLLKDKKADGVYTLSKLV